MMNRVSTTMLATICASVPLACSDEPAATPADSGVLPSASAEATADDDESATANQPPRIGRLSLRPTRPTPGQPVRVVAPVEDPEGDMVELEYEWSLEGTPVRAHGDEVTFPRAKKGDLIEVLVIATDSRGASSEKRIQTSIGNQAPQLTLVRIEPAGPVEQGVELTAHPEAVDPDHDPIHARYEWRVNGRTKPGETEHFNTQGLRRGDEIQAFAIVSDGREESDQLGSQLVVMSNTPPEITSEPGGFDEEDFTYQVRAHDPDNDRGLIFQLRQAPDGMTISRSDGLLAWAPRDDQLGRHTIEVVVEDRKGGEASQVFEIRIGDEAPPASTAEDRY
jgi:hypothetical protein